MARALLVWLSAVTLVLLAGTPAQAQRRRREHRKRAPLSIPVRDMPTMPPDEILRVIPLRHRTIWPTSAGGQAAPPAARAAVQTQFGPAAPTVAGANFEGGGQGLAGFTVSGAPPDTDGAAGRTQYVQLLNTAFTVFDKSSHAILAGPTNTNNLWSTLSSTNPCRTTNDGDGIVLYDHLADRWIITQFANALSTTGPFYECVAVSQTADATGQYFLYFFDYTNANGTQLLFNDYPKLGVWPDAYYYSANTFTAAGAGVGGILCGFDRTRMLNGLATLRGVGGPAGTASDSPPNTPAGNNQVCFNITDFGVLPSDLDGATLPPTGSPNYFLEWFDTSDLALFRFHIDFNTLSNSTLNGVNWVSPAGPNPSPSASIAAAGVPGASRNANLVTITTTTAHNFLVGLPVNIAGVTNSSFNGNFIIASVPTSTTFTYAQAGANATSGSGTATETRIPGLSIPVTSFVPTCNPVFPSFNSVCIPQSGTGQQLDSLSDRVMHRLAYRNFGAHESLVVNHSVQVSGTGSGVRWYEIQNPNGTPSVVQTGTWAPDSSWRWMGSAAMDKFGNLAIGYSVSSSSLHPAIRYAARLSTDTPGTLGNETSLIEGTGAQTPTLNRWGDYSALSIDPQDDCTFWYTNEYLTTNGTFNWHTRIGSFKLAQCQTTPSNTSVTPDTGAGHTQVFTFLYSDTGGASVITTTQGLFNTTNSLTSACAFQYNPGANTLQIFADNGTLGGTTITPGSGSLSNSQCTINGAGSSAGSAGNSLVVNVSVTFTTLTFSGAKNIYMNVTDTNGTTTGFQPMGSWIAQ